MNRNCSRRIVERNLMNYLLMMMIEGQRFIDEGGFSVVQNAKIRKSINWFVLSTIT